jgi:hypothetical protein
MQFFSQCPYQYSVLWVGTHTDSKIPLIHPFEVCATSYDNSMFSNEPLPELTTIPRLSKSDEQVIGFAGKEAKRIRQPVALPCIGVASHGPRVAICQCQPRRLRCNGIHGPGGDARFHCDSYLRMGDGIGHAKTGSTANLDRPESPLNSTAYSALCADLGAPSMSCCHAYDAGETLTCAQNVSSL